MTHSEWQQLQALIAKLSPSERHDLIDQLQSSPTAHNESATAVTAQRSAWISILKELDRLPVESPADGFSGSDHDSLLYGRWP